MKQSAVMAADRLDFRHLSKLSLSSRGGVVTNI
jgi:hypothetical protein